MEAGQQGSKEQQQQQMEAEGGAVQGEPQEERYALYKGANGSFPYLKIRKVVRVEEDGRAVIEFRGGGESHARDVLAILTKEQALVLVERVKALPEKMREIAVAMFAEIPEAVGAVTERMQSRLTPDIGTFAGGLYDPPAPNTDEPDLEEGGDGGGDNTEEA